MFPRFREQIGTALDLIVEFSTLGEYRLGAALAGPGAPGAPADAPGQAPQMGGAGEQPGAAGSAGRSGHPFVARAAVRRTVAGGAAGFMPVATPAARRSCGAAGPSQQLRDGRAPRPREGTPHWQEAGRPREGAGRPREGAGRPRVRKGAPAVAEQLCLAV